MCMPSLRRSNFDGLILACVVSGSNCYELCFFSMDTRRIRWRLSSFAIVIFKLYLTRFASQTCFHVRTVFTRAHAHDANFHCNTERFYTRASYSNENTSTPEEQRAAGRERDRDVN